MTQLQIFLFFGLNVYRISCIDNKQKTRTPDKNTNHCLINKHIWQYEDQGNFLKPQYQIRCCEKWGARSERFLMLVQTK